MKNSIEVEAALVKELGEKIGYGHLMSLASALWRQKLQEGGGPTSGAFIATCGFRLKKAELKTIQGDLNRYDSLIDNNHCLVKLLNVK